MNEKHGLFHGNPKIKKTGARALVKDDSSLQPTMIEDRSHLYIATSKPEVTLVSGQWELNVDFIRLDKTWSEVCAVYTNKLASITVVKCPTLASFHQQHKGYHENFYKEVTQASGQIQFYVKDCSDIKSIKQAYQELNDAFPKGKFSFTNHEKILTGRDSAFVSLNENGKLKFSEQRYLSFCQRHLVKPQALKVKEKAIFTHRFAGKFDFADLPEQFVVLDTETTGMDYVQGSVTEIGAVIVNKQDMKVVDTFQKLIRVEQKLDRFIVKLTGITDALLAESGRPAKEVLQDLRLFVKNMPIVAHNAKFDKGFVDMEFLKNGLHLLNNRWIDSVDLFHNHLPNRPSYALSALSHELLSEFKQAHRALADVQAVVGIMAIVSKQQKEKEGAQKPS